MTMDCGSLYDYLTGRRIREATLGELIASLRAEVSTSDATGVIELDGRAVYVQGEDAEAHRAAVAADPDGLCRPR